MQHATWRWRYAPVKPGPVAVFDMDGVLADSAQRQHFIAGPEQNWEAFFAACDGDAEDVAMRQVVDLIEPGVGVVLLTSRPIVVQPQTLAWLERTGMRWDLLIMRASRDDMSSRDFKHLEARRLLGAGFDIKVIFDDDERNIEAFRELGIPAVYIHSGYYG
jgi:hypothetical protein